MTLNCGNCIQIKSFLKGRDAMTGRHRFRRILTIREILCRRARTPVATASGCAIGLADGPTGIEHCVTDETFATGRSAGNGYVALCGARVLPASLTAPARFHCPTCERGV